MANGREQVGFDDFGNRRRFTQTASDIRGHIGLWILTRGRLSARAPVLRMRGPRLASCDDEPCRARRRRVVSVEVCEILAREFEGDPLVVGPNVLKR